MRRQDRQINDENEISEILSQGKFAVVSMCRDNEPYIVTLSYGYDKAQNAMYFHSALEGLKMEFITYNPNVCATIIEDRGYKMDKCSHRYRSLVINGKVSIVENLDDKKHGMEVLLDHLETTPSITKERALKSDNVYQNVAILKMDITNVVGKKGQ